MTTNDERVPILLVVIVALIWLWMLDTGRWTLVKQLWSYPNTGYIGQSGGTSAITEMVSVPSGNSSTSNNSTTGTDSVGSTIISAIAGWFGF